jgi:hypothetical protein
MLSPSNQVHLASADGVDVQRLSEKGKLETQTALEGMRQRAFGFKQCFSLSWSGFHFADKGGCNAIGYVARNVKFSLRSLGMLYRPEASVYRSCRIYREILRSGQVTVQTPRCVIPKNGASDPWGHTDDSLNRRVHQ